MATKFKGWTALLPVKAVCAILIPIVAFLALYTGVGLMQIDTDYLSVDILFVDIDANDYFYTARMNNAISELHTLLRLQSEEHIRDMSYLEWRRIETGADDYGRRIETGADGYEDIITRYELVSNYWGGIYWSEILWESDDLESVEAKQIVRDAINHQLAEYYEAKNWLDQSAGLYYHLTDGERVLSNTDEGKDFFKSQPVYYIGEPGQMPEQSIQWKYDSAIFEDNRPTAYIAFGRETVDAQNALWKDAQAKIGDGIVAIGICALSTLALLIILMVGAGRRYGTDGTKLTALDKPWLDVTLGLLILYEVVACVVFEALGKTAWRHGNIPWVYGLCAALPALAMPPFMWWLLSFVKHCKVGKFWQHTLIYVVLRGVFGTIGRFLMSLWAGFPLTAQAAGIGAVMLLTTLICAVTRPNGYTVLLCLAMTALATVGILRYARKLYLVEQGAKAASGGKHDTPIAVTGGELGRIATSINNMADGIGAAVAERMKSERLKTELITNVSHDIRTPLTSLITYTELLKKEGLDNEKAPEYLEVLIQKSARLKDLTDDLFEASKAASGNIEVRLETLDLADFVKQVLGELDERIKGSGLDFRLKLPERAPVRADGKLLWRVMQNLLSNVLKYAMPMSRVYIDITPDNGGARLEIKNISDTALNMDAWELTERFKRGDGARTSEGSGLGLSIAQSFVQAQGGRFLLSVDGDLFKAAVVLPEA